MKRLEVRSSIDEPLLVARALKPDHTEEMSTCVRDGALVTAVERDTIRSLQATADDYLVNVRVATELATAKQPERTPKASGQPNSRDQTNE